MLSRNRTSMHNEPDRKSTMSFHMTRVAVFVATAAFMASAPASAEILITQQKALAGNVSPGDLPGFPITLSRAGVYSLAGNLAVPAGKDGIVITDGDVSLDLNGFFMHGTGGVAKNGITGSVRNVTIRNGTLIDFGENGIDGQGPFWIVRDMRVIGSKGFAAIKCSDSCHVEGSIVFANENQGLDSQAGGGGAIGNVIANNGGQGVASGGAGIGNNALILNDGNRAGNTARMDPNMCRAERTLSLC
jgi:hypothetical protein